MKIREENPFAWKCEPEAEELIQRSLDEALKKNTVLKKLNEVLWEQTSTKLFDWVDHIELAYHETCIQDLEAVGFISDIATPLYRVFHHPAAQLPLVVMRDKKDPYSAVALKVESIADFLMVHGFSSCIEGSLYSPYRRACISREQGIFIFAVERRGVLTMEPVTIAKSDVENILHSYEKWQTRPRGGDTPDSERDAMLHAIRLAEEIVALLGHGMAAHVVFDVERRYWQSRNQAGQLQKNRQDRLGLGWANHDHHTFRSSRRYFQSLVRLFEVLGFHCRERFYAGKEAGWGAQVMEHPTARLVLFLDVDLTPHEVEIDFAHHHLEDLSHLGTVGLWCALHGESILKAGMHHLEAQFSFEKLQQDLERSGVGMMPPFSNFPYLKQAFTVGERWKVSKERVKRLLDKGFITENQAEHFLADGALGSHLENLERKEGYKGFNQKNVSSIIRKTDPRKN